MSASGADVGVAIESGYSESRKTEAKELMRGRTEVKVYDTMHDGGLRGSR